MSGAAGSKSLPEGWTLEPLSALGTWIGGGTPSKRRPEFWRDGTIPWVSPKDMKQRILDGTADKITEGAVEGSAAKLFGPNCIALVVRSGILAHTLPVALVPFRAAANQDMRVLIPRDDLDVRWLLHALIAHAPEIRRTCSKHGVTVASIEVPKLMSYVLPVPPPTQQARTAVVIEESLDRVERGRQQLEAAVRLTPGLLQAGLADLFRGSHAALPVWSREALAADRRVSIAEVCDVRYGWTPNAAGKGPGGLRTLRITDIQNGSVDWEAVPRYAVPGDQVDRYLLKAGDLVFARSGATTGKSYLIEEGAPKSVFASYLIRVRPGDLLRPEFLALYFQSSEYWSYIGRESRGMAQPNLNGSLLGALRIPVPDLEIQDAVIATARRHVNALRVVEAEVRNALLKGSALEKASYRSRFNVYA